MKQNHLFKNHFSIASGCDIKRICHPILDKLGLNSFTYCRTFEDNTIALLSSRPDWISVYLNNEFYKIGLEQPPFLQQSGVFNWDDFIDTPLKRHHRTYFDIKYGVTFIHKMEHYCEVISFGASSALRQPRLFMDARITEFNQFICYFREKCKLLIEQSTEHKIAADSSIENQKSALEVLNLNKIRDFPIYFYRDRFYLHYPNDHIWLSKRECEVMAWLMDGKSLWEISKILNISFRTVEDYLNRCKHKLNVRKQTRLVVELYKHGFRPEYFK